MWMLLSLRHFALTNLTVEALTAMPTIYVLYCHNAACIEKIRASPYKINLSIPNTLHINKQLFVHASWFMQQKGHHCEVRQLRNKQKFIYRSIHDFTRCIWVGHSLVDLSWSGSMQCIVLYGISHAWSEAFIKLFIENYKILKWASKQTSALQNFSAACFVDM
jgi:hypothetical protein